MPSRDTPRKSEPATRSTLPHSWDLDSWPETTWPHDAKRARYISKAYRTELIEERAVARVGKSLVFLGEGYTRWLKRRTRNVDAFVSNNPAMAKSAPRAASTSTGDRS